MSFDEIASRYQALEKLLGGASHGNAAPSSAGGLDGFLERCFEAGATGLNPSQWTA
jgi:hypothetical protein